MIKLTIDGKEVRAAEGKTVLEAALGAGIYIPNLCYHPDISPIGACRLCIVEIEGVRGVPASCATAAKDGMVVRTNTDKIRRLRQDLMWLTMSETATGAVGHPLGPQGLDGHRTSGPVQGRRADDLTQLKQVAEYIGGKDLLPGYVPRTRGLPVNSDEPFIVKDLNKCVLCGRCVRMCREVRKTGVIGLLNRGTKTIVGTGGNLPLKDAGCKFCLACVEMCPSGALTDREKIDCSSRDKTLLPCTNTCPAGIDASRYVRLIAEGRYQDAVEVIREKAPFPLVLGYACSHKCEEACRRGQLNEPIAIRALKRFVAERDSGRWKSKIRIPPDTGKKIAVVGSGPAGLTAAWFLRKLGHQVTVFEALPEPGGMMRTGIPEYRLPKKILNREIKDITDIGVKIKTGVKVESLDELFGQGYNAIFVSLGAMDSVKSGTLGEDDPRVLDGISMLRTISFGKKPDIAGDVVVVGGGNVAIDVARSALRAGAKSAAILYRRTRQEMPALPEEVEDALAEGVKIRYLVAPVKITPARDSKRGAGRGSLDIECVRMELGEPDAGGRRRPVPIPGSKLVIKADRLITAIGQRSSVPEKFALPLHKKGAILADPETLASSRDGVFAGGDAVSGPASIIEAIRDGRIAAASIDRYLGGRGDIDQKFAPDDIESPHLGRDEKFAYRKRAQIKKIPVAKRRRCFAMVEHGFDEKTAAGEAERCMRCSLRLKISKPPLPPKNNNGNIKK